MAGRKRPGDGAGVAVLARRLPRWIVLNAQLADRLGEQWDPVVRDDIMYSAYVESCATLTIISADSLGRAGLCHVPALVVLLGRAGEAVPLCRSR
jgi:hypothetical protein